MYRDVDVEKTQTVPSNREQLEEMKRSQARFQDQCSTGGAMREMTDDEKLVELFKYHSPNETTIPKYAAINQAAKNFAEVLLQNCPRCADRSAAIRLIRDARMTANAAVALNGLSL